jgi:hypothetical protein
MSALVFWSFVFDFTSFNPEPWISVNVKSNERVESATNQFTLHNNQPHLHRSTGKQLHDDE